MIDETVFWCNNCDEIYEDKIDVCEFCGCESIREVSKGDI